MAKFKVFPYVPKENIEYMSPIQKAEFDYKVIPNLGVAFDCEHCNHCMIRRLIVHMLKNTEHQYVTQVVCTKPACNSKHTFTFIEVEDEA